MSEHLLDRAHVVLSNMARENELHWWEFWKPRWAIGHEPLRGDARNVALAIEEHWAKENARALSRGG